MIFAYIRVSSFEQNEARQIEGIKGAGIKTDRTYMDKLSGKDTERPQLQALLANLRKDDTLVCWSIDRLARNVADMLKMVKELTERGITIRFIKENLTFNGDDSPMSKLQLTMMGAFAEFERDLIKERQLEGIAIAKAKGVYKGRKPVLTPEKAVELRQRAATGISKELLAEEFGVSRSALYNYLKPAVESDWVSQIPA